ncbi:MAG: hypothetical protein ACOZDY_16370 [Pseudomonadota bacterium]
MRFTRILLFVLAFFFTAGAIAGRTLPEAGRLAQISGFYYPEVAVGSSVYRLAPGAKIFDQWNRVVMPPRLPVGAKALFLLDANGNIVRVWLLTPEELAAVEQRRR